MGQWAVGVSLLLVFAIVATEDPTKYNNIKILDFKTCPDNDHLVAKFIHSDFERISKDMISVNATLEIKTEIIDDYSVLVDFKQCESKSETHTCKQFMTKTADDFCNHLNDPDEAWTDFVEKSEPRFECPIVKGKYVTRNAFVDASALNDVPEGFWMAEIKAMKESVVLGCVRITARIWPDVLPDEDR